MFRILSLGGYVAFDLPRVVTGLGAALLAGVAAVHGYLMYAVANRDALPAAFVVYAGAVIAACLLAAIGMAFGRNPAVTQAGWYFGSLLSAGILGVDVATRIASLPGMTAVTGRWDVAPATFALAFAGAFIGLHVSVLLGINVAYPRRQHWDD
ncbi:oxidoreductase [Mycobacterium sp. 852002-50816_SCH5313054-b]|uniref:oxidoreductase n=1 Tax=Mycobacterium sp. 852002-50816_SCH5313054-b TaxID=1834092 RepID=UPI000800AEEB|nr:oxidoreductase [Mycobacterium sp. 852002-50816_SCH5313054-b]OBF53314.1 oxidoreductase [Mycobacterium sp. 852002-50816_SCH5313054-b]